MFRLGFLLAIVSFQGAFSATIPDYIKVCHRSDPQLTGCIKNSVEALRPVLVKGIPELNVPGIDPFVIKKLVVFDGVEIPGLKASLDNFELHGLGKFQITKLKLDVERLTFRIGVTIPYVQMQSDFNLEANLFQRPIIASGGFKANATNLDGQAVLQGALTEDNHLVFESMAFKLKIGDYHMDPNNFHSDDPTLAEIMRQMLVNADKQAIIRLATPRIEEKCSEILLKLSNEIVENFNYNEIFPV